MFVLRGELFKAGESNPAYKLRWFELTAEGVLSWAEQEGQPAKSCVSLRGALIAFEPDRKPAKADGDARFGLRVTPAGGGRSYSLRSSSDEERRFWAEAMDQAAHPNVGACRASAGRIVRLTRPADGRLGVDLGSPTGTPCVTVVSLGPAAAQCGLLVGDVIVGVDVTVLRTAAIAERVFSRIGPRQMMTLRLAGHNREVRVLKQAGVSGLTLSAPVNGPGVLVHGVTRDSAAAVAGLHVGDRVLAINSRHCDPGQHEQASELIKQALQEVRLVVSGTTVSIAMRKDTDGRIGIAFHSGAAGRHVQGALISDVVTRSAAHQAGLRNGDVLVAVDSDLVLDAAAAIELLTGAARAITLVVWRPRPDPSDEELPPITTVCVLAGARTSLREHPTFVMCETTRALSPRTCTVRLPTQAAVAHAVEESTGVGTVPVEYYTHNLVNGTISMSSHQPQQISSFEDLTHGSAGGARAVS